MAFIITDSGEVMEGTILTEEESAVLDQMVLAIKEAITEYIGSRSVNRMRLAIVQTARLTRREVAAAPAEPPAPEWLPPVATLTPVPDREDLPL